MLLLLSNPQNQDLTDLCADIITKLSIKAKDNIWYTSGLTSLWDNYLSELYKPAKVSPTVVQIFEGYFDNLIYEQQGTDYIIRVDPNARLEGVEATIQELANIINYGTLDMPSYPIFDKLFDAEAEELTSEQEQEDE